MRMYRIGGTAMNDFMPGKECAGKKLEKLNCKAGRLCMIVTSPSPVRSTLWLLEPFFTENFSGSTGSLIFSFSAFHVNQIW